MTSLISLNEAQYILKSGGVIAYPTESVYGLGCDAFHEPAVYRILALKKRDVSKGLIILIHDWAQLFSLIAPISDDCIDRVQNTWPGPVTWVFPKSSKTPDFLSGGHEGIAIRMSAHPVAKALCIDAPIVSTSANVSNMAPARDFNTVITQFLDSIDGVVDGDIGKEPQPSVILDVLSGNRFR
jgi:L-threonylcarbamoyladenylate synthase